MKYILVAGGDVDTVQLNEMYHGTDKPFVIGIDKGCIYLLDAGIPIDLAVGDFDSVSDSERERINAAKEVEVLIPEKDDSDTEHAIRYVLERRDAEEVILMGCTGSRLDHTLSCINELICFEKKGIRASILNRTNRIRLGNGHIDFRKEELFGKYLSFIPFYEKVVVNRISGFKYDIVNPLVLTKDLSRCVSNELLESSGYIDVDGFIIIMETMD